METLVKQISQDLITGRFKLRLKEYCLRWRSVKSAYVTENVISHLFDQNDSRNLFNVLTDPDFRKLKKQDFGINALRHDLQKGLSYFSRVQPNVLSYIQLLFLEQRTEPEIADEIKFSQGNCQEYSTFLQLDLPPNRRHNIGIQRVFNEIFPFVLKKKSSGSGLNDVDRSKGSVRVEFVDYELGSWHCQCKATVGQMRRFDYGCSCGRTRGNGILEESAGACPVCQEFPAYSLCPTCGTRVTLDLLWQIQEGSLHPCQLKLPLVISLTTNESGDKNSIKLKLLDLPALLGLREREGQILLEPPDLFWLDTAPADDFIPKGHSTQLIAFDHPIQYKGQTTLSGALESILKDALRSKGRGSIKSKLRSVILKGHNRDFSGGLSRQFNDVLTWHRNGITRTMVGHSDLTRAIDISMECLIAESDSVEPNSVIVNRALRERGSLHSQSVINFATVLKRHTYGDDVLSASPLQQTKTDSMDDDGIVKVGATVKPFDTLVGIESPLRRLTYEEILLRDIFGSAPNSIKDASLVFHSIYSGTVLAVNIIASKRWKEYLKSSFGRFISFDEAGNLRDGELAKINVAIAVEQPIEVGDTLYAEDGTEGVVCDFIGGAALAKMAKCSEIPDMVVRTGHAWARNSQDSKFQRIRVKLKNDSMQSSSVKVRGIGPYEYIRNRPMFRTYDVDAAQELNADHFEWLLACEAVNTSFELYGPRCDCVDWRNRTFEALVKQRFRLVDLYSKANSSEENGEKKGFWFEGPFPDYSDLKCPSENVRYLDRLLRALSIRMAFTGNDSPQTKLAFSLTNDLPSDSYGEVTSSQTIQLENQKCYEGGLFCEVIFGPVKDYQCSCGKYNRRAQHKTICEKCNVEVMPASVRRQRMGHISLSASIVHPLYISSICVYLAEMFKLPPAEIKAVIYFDKTLAIDSSLLDESKYSVITQEQAQALRHRESAGTVRLLQGAKAINELLLTQLNGVTSERRHWQDVITKSIVVLPPDRRPIIATSDGNFLKSDVNDLYRLLIERNRRLKKLEELRAPRVIINEATGLLQRGVNYLFDNTMSDPPYMRDSNSRMHSLGDTITDFAGQNSTLLDGLLHRSIDFSAITRLVTGETPDIDSAFVPKRFLWELLKPLLLGELERMGVSSIRLARDEVHRRSELAYSALLEVTKNAMVLISPSFCSWRLIALRPIISTNLAIAIHPELLRTIGEANFGKPVKVFSVLSEEAIKEATERLLPSQLAKSKSLLSACARVKNEKPKSAFYIDKKDLLSELAQRALMRSSHALTAFDRLILCLPPKNSGQ